MFLYKNDDRCITKMTERRLISVRSSGSIWITNSQTDGLVVEVQELATMVNGSELIRLPCMWLHKSYGVCTKGEHERRTTLVNSQHCKKHQQCCNAWYSYKFSGHTSWKKYPTRWRTLRTTSVSAERWICNCTFNNVAQQMHNAPRAFLIYWLYFKNA